MSKINKQFKWFIWIIIIGLGVYGIVYVSAKNQKLRPGEEIKILGREHISVGAAHPAYNSNPPTSGWHYAQPAAWGMYQQELPDEQLIHNIEHGGIWISYKDTDEETKTKLETISKEFPRSVIVTLRSQNDSPIALASWGRLLKLQSLDEAAITEFIKSNTNKSPEPLAY